uniref:Kinesin motor domain-containing protein n=1 Tax=Parastrongyloides trichosuri TaxID=131310 RepID=A0A0N5A653_PARTI
MEKDSISNLYSEIKKKKKNPNNDTSDVGGKGGIKNDSSGKNNLSIPPSTIKMIESAGDPDIPIRSTNIPKLQIYAKISDYNLKNDRIEIIKDTKDIDFGFNFLANSGAVINSNCGFNHVFKPEDTIKKMAPTLLAPLYQLLFNGFNSSLIYMGSLGNDKTAFLYQNTFPSTYGFFLHTLQWGFSLLSTYLHSNSLSQDDGMIKLSAIHFSQRNNTITDLMSIFTENYEHNKKDNSNISYYDNISDIYENDDDIDLVKKEMKKLDNLKEIHIKTFEDGLSYLRRIMEFQNLGDDETQRTEHTFYFINLYRKQKKSKDIIVNSDEMSGNNMFTKSTLTLIDMGLGERKSKGDPNIITMPGISNILQSIFQGHKQQVLASNTSLFTLLLQEYLLNSKNKSTIMLTNFSPGDRVNDQANIFHLFCKLFKLTHGGRRSLQNIKEKFGWNSNDAINNYQENKPKSEVSGAETVIFLGDEVISRSSLMGGSDNDKTIKGSNNSDCSKKSFKNKIITSKNAIPIDFPPTIEKQILAGYSNCFFGSPCDDQIISNVKKGNTLKNVIENVFGEEYISREREYMIWKWMKETQGEEIDSENIIFENTYIDMEKSKLLKKSDTSKTDSGIQCDDNEIDHEQMKLWITRRHLDDITEVDEDISCKSNLLSRRSRNYFERGSSMQREALAEKDLPCEDHCSIDKILSPLRVLKENCLRSKVNISQMSLEDISLNENGNSEDDIECESIPDDDLEKAMEASLSLSSIKSHEILCRMNKNNRNSLISNTIPEEKSVSNYTSIPSTSTTPSETAFYRRASLLELYAEEKLHDILNKEEAENNKRKKQNIFGKKIKNVIPDNILKCCDKNVTNSSDSSTLSKDDNMFIYDTSSLNKTSSKQSLLVNNKMGNNYHTDSMNPVNGSINKGWKLPTSPSSLKCCFSPMINSETSITSGELSNFTLNEDKKDSVESKVPTISEEDRKLIKEQLTSYNKKQRSISNTMSPRQHSSLPITPLKKLSLQSPLKRIEEAERKIKSQGGGTITTSNSSFLTTYNPKDGIITLPGNQRNSRSNSIDLIEGYYDTNSLTKLRKGNNSMKVKDTTNLGGTNSSTLKRNIKQGIMNNGKKSSNLPILLNSKLPPSPYSKITNAKMVDFNNSTVSSGHGSEEITNNTAASPSINGSVSPPVFSPKAINNGGFNNNNSSINKSKNRESFSASSGYESADYLNIHYNLKSLNIKNINNKKLENSKDICPVDVDCSSFPINTTIKVIKDEQETLKKELKEAQQRIHIHGDGEEEEMTLSDEKVFEDMDKDTIIQTLLTENKVLRKRILAARNHVMMVTSFL